MTGFTGGAGSRTELVDRFVEAVAAADTTALLDLTMNRNEFAWLYYPNSIYTTASYDLAPDIVWLQHENYHGRGFARLMGDLAGQTLYYTGHRCLPYEGEPLGPMRYWERCVVLGELPDGEAVEQTLFGGILELNGRFKFLSYSNDL